MIRYIGIAVAVLVALAVAALLAAPEFVDWNRHRAEVAARMQDVLGRPVAIDGPLSLSLLPVPHLTAAKLRLPGSGGGGVADLAQVERVELQLKTLPLIEGRFEVSSLVLVSPHIELERLADGRANWTLPAANGGQGNNPPPLPLSGPDLVLDRVQVRGGSVIFSQPNRRSLNIENLDATLDAEGPNGPYRLHATLKGWGFPLAVDGSLTPGDGPGPVPVDLAVALAGDAGRLTISGTLNGKGDAASFKGRASLRAPKVRQLAAALGWPDLPIADGPLALQTPLTASPREIFAQSVTLDMPNLSANGVLAANLQNDPQIDIKLATTRLDLDAWIAAAGKARAAAAPAATRQPASAAPGFALPTGLSASLDLTAEGVLWRGGLLQRARVNALLTNGEITLNQAGASLPGDSQLNLFGFIDAIDGQPAFDGSFETGSNDLRGLLRWLNIDASAVPPDRLGAGRFTGRLRAAPGRIRLDGAQLRVDGTRIDAALDLRLGARPALGASFAVDTLNLDAYLPPAAATGRTPSGGGLAALGAALGGGVPDWLQGFDANFKGRIGQFVGGGLAISGIEADGAWVDGNLSLHSLSAADLDGAHAMLSGEFAGFAGPSPRVSGLHLDLHSDDASRLLQLAGAGPAPDGGRWGALAFQAAIDGDRDRATVQSKLELAGGSVAVSGEVKQPFTAPTFDLGVEASHSSLAGLMRLLGSDSQPPPGIGGLAASFHLAGDPAHLTLTDLRMQGGPLSAAGQASIAWGPTPHIDATLTAGDLPADLFFAALKGAGGTTVPSGAAASGKSPAAATAGNVAGHFSLDPIDFGWLDGWDGSLKLDATALIWGHTRLESPAIAISLAGGKATIDHLTANLYGGQIAATGAVSSGGDATLSVHFDHAELKQALLGAADLDLVDGQLDVEADLTSAGHSLAEMVARLEGSGKIAGHDGTLRGFDLAAADQRLRNSSPASLLTLVQAGLNGGETKFSSLTGDFHVVGGVVTTDDLDLVAEGGEVKGAGVVNLPGYTVDGRAAIHLADAPDAPPLIMHLSGPLDAPRRILDINAIQNWLAERGAAKADQGAAKTP